MTVGKKATPTALQKLKGRSHHKKEAPEIILPMDVATVKAKEALESIDLYSVTPDEVWSSLCERGIAKKSDVLAFRKYLDFYQIYQVSLETIRANGSVIIYDNKGNMKLHPAWTAMLDAQSMMSKIEAEFGLTPSSKRKVLAGSTDVLNVSDTKTESDLQEIADYENLREDLRKAKKPKAN